MNYACEPIKLILTECNELYRKKFSYKNTKEET